MTCAMAGGRCPKGRGLPEDQIADLPMRMIAAEITREKLTLRLHQELPYQLTVETETWEDRKDGSAKIDQMIYVCAMVTRASCWATRARRSRRSARRRGENRRMSGSQGASVPAGQSAPELAGTRPSAITEMGLDFKDGG